jgi:hypothetical protein
MIAVAYFAICCTAFVAVIHDRSRPDLYTGFAASGIGLNTTSRLRHRRGRELTAAWGFASVNLVAFAAVLLFFQLADVHVSVNKNTNIPWMLGMMFVPPSLAIAAGNAGAWVTLRLADRKP